MGGKLNLLPDAKLTDHAQVIASVQRILDAYPDIETVLVRDGWPVFHDGKSDACHAVRALNIAAG